MPTDVENAISILGDLIAFNTVSDRSNLEIVEYIESYLNDHGIASYRVADANLKKAGLFATIGDPSIPGYVLSGHTDVVPTDGQDWTKEPFNMTEEDGRLYGRGTSDMKGYLACMLAAVPALVKAEPALPIHLAFSHDEEIGCLGAPILIDEMIKHMAKPIAAFVGEPSQMMIKDCHKGSCGMTTTITGLACHSSRPDLGASAIGAAASVVEHIHAIGAELASNPRPELNAYEVPYSTTTCGVIHGGTARNLIAGDCVIQWDIREAWPGDKAMIQERVETFIQTKVLPDLRSAFANATIDTEVAYDVPSLSAKEGSELETLVKRFAAQNQTSSASFATEAGIFDNAGIPAVVCGPGRDSEAHIEDEWVAKDQIAACMAFMERLTDAVKPNT
ncbi:acetylornithine deacetylase [Pacificibacter sp. AS14]|uniref:acetylornithine deacetylase n=1 Tax=Alphaproteobacteria TaxID=28211 RepID=UPI003176E433